MINMAIMGAGSIANLMAQTIIQMSNVRGYAIGARDLSRAQKFADKYGFMKAYGSYSELVNDPEVDLVYIATPHSHHYNCAKMALDAGKHVLCEKPFTVNAKQAIGLFKMAADKKLLISEAMWTRYMPSRNIVNSIIESGAIGDVKTVIANLGYELANVKRIHDPELAGGALLDVGVYTINFVRMVLGKEMTDLESYAIFDGGVDIADTIVMKYSNGRLASLQCGVNSIYNRLGLIAGTKGYIEVQNINNPEEIRLYNMDHQLVKKYEIPEQITGYEYEVMACCKAIEEKKLECPEMPHDETVQVIKVMDQLREAWGYEIPGID